ncbi:MAG: M23 family metallopeptidase [Candidatus Peribacteraceae bacterium]|nr:M23 family metallopeptidase [Candidatus Peribacteraceae bacterium]MDD5074433.1 M23 family metallopeptidase [Candidatus Peribacteraceae bacterium]
MSGVSWTFSSSHAYIHSVGLRSGFATPVGSIVLAARDGIVRELSMSSNHFSRDLDLAPDKVADYVAFVTNWISLEHDDGLQTVYAHLMSESQRVERGQRVHAGQILARTGLSGWMGDIDNLHFHVQEWQLPAEHGGRGRTATVRFFLNGYKGPLEHGELFPQNK